MTGIPFTQVTTENFDSLYDAIVDKVAGAKYVAIDTEFSGHCQTYPKHMEQRYSELAAVIRQHAILAMGMTVMRHDGTSDSYDFLLSNKTVHQVDPSNLEFLAHHGFDFNRQLRYGLGYRPGPYNGAAVQQQQSKNQKAPPRGMRELWIDIHRQVRANRIPLVVHNGLIDLMYVYQSFITTLPAAFQPFVADLVDAFPGGIYDTKYLALRVLNEKATFLGYLYCKYMRGKRKRDTTDGQDDQEPPVKKPRQGCPAICEDFASRGYCRGGLHCKLSHDLNQILERDEKNDGDAAPPSSIIPMPPSEMHAAYFDAFMTAYIFNHMAAALGKDGLDEHINKLNLMRLDIPLRLAKSDYAHPTDAWIQVKNVIGDR